MPALEFMATVVGLQAPPRVLYPLRNTSVDPTSAFWRANNPGYIFTPNVGITTIGPLINANGMVYNNKTFNDPDIVTWDTSNVTNMGYMFSGCTAFNQSVSNFNTANVTNMLQMFINCTAFNQSVSNFDTSNVTNMGGMFYGCTNFNCGQASGVAHDLMQRTATGGWRVNNVTNMNNMFQSNRAFNGNISNWCVNNFALAPTNFAINANANFTAARQPTWGTCPIP